MNRKHKFGCISKRTKKSQNKFEINGKQTKRQSGSIHSGLIIKLEHNIAKQGKIMKNRTKLAKQCKTMQNYFKNGKQNKRQNPCRIDIKKCDTI